MDYIEKFTNHLIKINLSKSSIDNYRRDLRNFKKYLLDEYDKSLCEAKKSHVLTYFIALQKNNYKQATINRYISSIKKFYNFLEQDKILKYNPTRNLTTNKIMHKPIEILDRNTIEKFFNMVYNQKGNFMICRDIALLELMYSTGIRLSELIEMKKEDISFSSELIMINGSNPRAVPMSDSTKKALKQYFDNFLCEFSDIEYVFLGNKYKKITRQGVWNIFKRYKVDYEKTYGLDINFTPKTLTNSFIVHIIENGADSISVQKILGRKNPISMKNYSSEIDKNVLKIYSSTNPRRKGVIKND